ncbi:potassium transporter Kup [Geminicoccus roseus]|uniref:potassium transporter Kup n=1 Tax=Geminicoccus roseus TaxID=404900 RepID=UPI0004165BC3|nr:potassium transporter Kup [Geminicoccus roseus]
MAQSPAVSTADPKDPGAGKLRAGTVLAALGVVFGDIGTSPLYTMREAFGHAGGLVLDEPHVLGVLSLVFWSLTLIVAIKYVVLIMRADNKGEGGVLALAALALGSGGARGDARKFVVLTLAMIGVGLFYGDAIITPAISVLSAVEGLQTLDARLEAYVVPIAVAILLALFMIQRQGTAMVGRLFGPIMLVWFSVLVVLGLVQIVQHPSVLRAVDPTWAIHFLHEEGLHAFVAMGAVVLCVTGAEALYADMGHFGRGAIRMSWFGAVMPALVINYFGQGALILNQPEAIVSPFYHMVPDWGLVPLILLATLATIVASQAVISGVFSLTSQAVRLGYLPRMAMRHTSEHEIGQVYIPRINWLLAVGVLALVLAFENSSGLAAAYGIAVTSAMGIDAILAGLVAIWLWRWSRLTSVLVFGSLLCLDAAYIIANSLKIPAGGWMPLLLAAVVYLMLRTWVRGRRVLATLRTAHAMSIDLFIRSVTSSSRCQRVAGTAVVLCSDLTVVPNTLLHNLKHNHVLHEQVVLLTVRTDDVPRVPLHQGVEARKLSDGFWTVVVRFGFMDRPDIPAALRVAAQAGLTVDPSRASYFLGRETLVPSTRDYLGPFEERLFISMSATATDPTAYFELPPDRVIEVGTQIEV